MMMRTRTSTLIAQRTRIVYNNKNNNNDDDDVPYQITNDGKDFRDQRLNHAVQDKSVSTGLLTLPCIMLPTLLVGVTTGPRSNARAALCVLFVAFGLHAVITGSLLRHATAHLLRPLWL